MPFRQVVFSISFHHGIMDLHIHTLFARCSHVAAAREDAAVGAGGGDQGTGVAGRRSGGDPSGTSCAQCARLRGWQSSRMASC